MLARGYPQYMTPPEAVLVWGMGVGLLVGIAVVLAVMGGPPQWTTLQGAVADKREEELCPARGAKGAMREIAVVKTGYREHAYGIRGGGNRQRGRAETDPECTKAGQVNQAKGQSAEPFGSVVADHLVAVGIGGVEPADQIVVPRAADGHTQGLGLSILVVRGRLFCHVYTITKVKVKSAVEKKYTGGGWGICGAIFGERNFADCAMAGYTGFGPVCVGGDQWRWQRTGEPWLKKSYC